MTEVVKMKIWLDDVRPAPEGYVWCRSVRAAQLVIESNEYNAQWFSDRANELYREGRFEFAKRMGRACQEHIIELIDVDHDAGDFACCGGDYIKLLDWLEETRRNYPIRIHSQNPVGVENMRRIIQKNGWKEVL